MGTVRKRYHYCMVGKGLYEVHDYTLGHGVVLACCDRADVAQRIVDALNAAEPAT